MSVIITRDIKAKLDERRAGIQFVFTSNDYRYNWTTRNHITNSLKKITISENESCVSSYLWHSHRMYKVIELLLLK